MDRRNFCVFALVVISFVGITQSAESSTPYIYVVLGTDDTIIQVWNETGEVVSKIKAADEWHGEHVSLLKQLNYKTLIWEQSSWYPRSLTVGYLAENGTTLLSKKNINLPYTTPDPLCDNYQYFLQIPDVNDNVYLFHWRLDRTGICLIPLDINSGTIQKTKYITGNISFISLLPSETVLVRDYNNTYQIYDLNSGKMKPLFNFPKDITYIEDKSYGNGRIGFIDYWGFSASLYLSDQYNYDKWTKVASGIRSGSNPASIAVEKEAIWFAPFWNRASRYWIKNGTLASTVLLDDSEKIREIVSIN